MSRKFPQKFRGNVFRNSSTMSKKFFFAQTNQFVGPAIVQWKWSIETRWYQSGFISGWLLSGQRVLINFSTMSRKFPRQFRGNVFRNSSTMSRNLNNIFFEIVEELIKTLRKTFPRHCRGIDTRGIFEEFPSSTRTQLEPRTSTRPIAKLCTLLQKNWTELNWVYYSRPIQWHIM